MWKRVKYTTGESDKRNAISNLLSMKRAMFDRREVVFGVYIAIMDALVILPLDSIEKGKCDCNAGDRDGSQNAGRSEVPCEAQAGKEKE